VDVTLPVAANTKDRKDEPKTITVAINRDGVAYLGTTPKPNRQELVPEVKERLQELPDGEKIVYLKADEQLLYSEVMAVMDLLREAGVEEIALIATQQAGA
jgi:biopolymer transport protein ExbD/biopolymer transport protein TolR